MTKSIVTKILQEPISYLKENATRRQELAKIVSELFSLDGKH